MSRRVLLVDDEERVTSGLRRNLRRRFEIETCNDPEAALALVAGQEEPFSVVVSDYQMPGLNGIDFLARVRTIAPDTAVVGDRTTFECRCCCQNHDSRLAFMSLSSAT